MNPSKCTVDAVDDDDDGDDEYRTCQPFEEQYNHYLHCYLRYCLNYNSPASKWCTTARTPSCSAATSSPLYRSSYSTR